MARTRWLLLGTAALVLIGLVWLYDSSRELERRQIDEIDGLLNELSLLDGALKRHLFRSHFRFEGSFDAIIALQAAIARNLDALSRRLTRIDDPDIAQELAGLREDFAAQQALIEPLKSANALYRNAMTYLPRVKESFEKQVDKLGHHNDYHELLYWLMQRAFSGQTSRQGDAQPKTLDRVAELQAMIGQEPAAVQRTGDRLIRHLRTIIEYRTTSEALLDELSRGDQQVGGGVQVAYSAWAERQAQTARRYRRMLFGAAIALSALALVLFQQSRRRGQELQQAHAELASKQAALDDHAIVSMTDRRGNIIYVNDKFCEISGYDREELIGQNHRLLKSGEHSSEFYQDLWRTVVRGEAWHGEICNRNKDGGFYWVYATIKALPDADGRPRQIVSIRTDLTYRRKIESELREHQEHLEQLVAERTAELNEAVEAAHQASKAKSIFLANMSHEIRTPLNAILGMTTLIKRSLSDPEQLGRVEKLGVATKHLMALINDILDNARIESGRIELERLPLRIGLVFSNVQSMIGGRFREKQLRFDIDMDPALEEMELIGDPVRMDQILINFLSNALKFTSEGGVTVSARLVEDGPETAVVRFAVADTGIGISQESQERVFSQFEQAETSTSREYGGTGLGLAISRGLALLMGGECGVNSEPGRGSEFWFTARLDKAVGVEASQDEQVSLDGRHDARILLVEDNEINREIAITILSEAGLQVDEAVDGVEAVERIAEGEYDLVFMDVRMPRMDGLEATRQIRAAGVSVPIVALTANAFAEDREECRQAGMDDFVPKPFEPEMLYAAVARWIPVKAGASDAESGSG